MGVFVLRRLRSRLALAGAALLTIVLTAAVLTTLAAFDSGVGDAGLRRALATRDRDRATVQVTENVDAGGRAAAEQQVQGLASDVFGDRSPVVRRAARSNPYGLPPAATAPGGKPAADPDLTLLASLDRAQARLTAGRWPAAAKAGSPTEVAMPDAAAQRFGLRPEALPAKLQLADRITGGTLEVLVTGSYRPLDRGDPYWQLDPLGGRGLRVNGFATYGPLLTDDSAFTTGAVPQYGLSWLITADLARVGAADLGTLRARVLARTVNPEATAGLHVTSHLPEALDELSSDLLVARSTLVIGALQLTVLAGAALILVTRLLTERQEAENELLTARGAARGRLAALSAAECALLALPATLLGPLLTPLLLRVLGSYGPLARAGVRLDGGLSAGSWAVALLVAAGCVLTVLAPSALRDAVTATLRRAGRRQTVVSALARSGADLALVALAVLAYLQLSHYRSGSSGGGLSADTNGRLGLDPLLVTAPTLALCAGTMIVLRVLPWVARLGERLSARGRGLAAALAGWQFARRPGRHAGPVLLLVLAVSMGMLALGQGASWNASQRDQADHATAGGLRVTETGLLAMGQGGVLGALPGGDRVVPVARYEVPLHGGRAGQLLALDTAAATRVRVRPDQTGGRSSAQLFGPLAAPAPTGAAAGIVLPGRPQRIDLHVSVRITAHGPAPVPAPGSAGFPFFDPAGPDPHHPIVRLELQDRFQTPYELFVPALPADGDATVSVDLSPFIGLPVGAAAYPLTLTGFEISYNEALDGGVDQTLTIRRIAAADNPTQAATTAALPAGLHWDLHSIAPTDPPSAGPGTPPGNLPPPRSTTATVAPVGDQAALRLGYFTGVGTTDTTAVLTAAGASGPPPVPAAVDALATDDYLTASGATVGQTVPVELGGTTVQFTIVAAVHGLPAVGGDEAGSSAALIADLATVDRVIAADRQQPSAPTEWWLPGDSPGDPIPAQAAAALRSSTAAVQLQVDTELTGDLRTDPLGAAPQSALLAIAAVAALLAAIGFAAGAAGAAGERAAEFAVLRALGTPQRRLARTTAAEQGILILLGLGVGVGLGTLLVKLVVPLVVLTPAAHRPMPDVLVQLPPGQVALLILAVAALPALITVRAVLRPTRATDTATRLRLSEEL